MESIMKTQVVLESGRKKQLVFRDFEFDALDLKGVIDSDHQGYTDIILPGGVFTIVEDYEVMSEIYNKIKDEIKKNTD